MKWIKQGLIFRPNQNYDWMISHASLPVIEDVNDSVLRIYFGTRDTFGRSRLGFVEVKANNPHEITYVHNKPVLPLGKVGTFDDNGIMPSWLVRHDGRKYLYYIGWNPQVTVSYRLSIGLAVADESKQEFCKYSEGPVCDRAVTEPYFTTAPCVLIDGRTWKMWYVSCTGWEIINSRSEPRYHIKYAESGDGVEWQRTGRVCIDGSDPGEAIGRPCVFQEHGMYKMFYSYRRIKNYRSDRRSSYRLGYAESADGLHWIRKDSDVGIERSNNGWDSKMIEYSYIHHYKGRKYLFYNGNDFGATGFGYAILEE